MRNLKIGGSTINSITVGGNLVHTVKLNDGTVVFSNPCSVYIYLSNLYIADSATASGTSCGSSYDDTKIKLGTPQITFSQSSGNISLSVSKITFSGYVDVYDHYASDTRMINSSSMNFTLYPGNSQSLSLKSSEFGAWHDTDSEGWRDIDIKPSMSYTIYDTNGGSTSGSLYSNSASVSDSATSAVIGYETIDL